MAIIKRYKMSIHRLKKSHMEGVYLKPDGGIALYGEDQIHRLSLTKLDSVEKDCQWGRLHMEVRLPKGSYYKVYVMALNHQESPIDGFPQDIPSGCKTWTNQSDILLYNLKGRYMWIYIEVVGKGEGTIEKIWVENPGDNFMKAFPEIYHEDNSFFHRYMSIYSSIYNDFQRKIDHIDEQLDFKTAPATILPLFCKWLGLEGMDGILKQESLRKLLVNLYDLNRIKGTREALLRITKLLLGEDAILIERSAISKYINEEEKQVYDVLYGKSELEVTLLIRRKTQNEARKAQLLFLIDQFKPVRSKVQIIFFKAGANVDSYCFMDMNVRITEHPQGQLDGNTMLDESVLDNTTDNL